MPLIICTAWTPSVRETRQGFCDLSLPDSGITLRGCVLHQTIKGKRWVSWPATETGRGYSACAKFMATVEHDEWHRQAVQAIDKFRASVDAGGFEMPVLL